MWACRRHSLCFIQKNEQKQIIESINITVKKKIVLRRCIFLAIVLPIIFFAACRFIPSIVAVNAICVAVISLVSLNVQKKMWQTDKEISENTIHFISASEAAQPEDMKPGIYLVEAKSMDELNEFLQNVGMDTEQTEELKNMLGGAFAADKEKEITDEKDD